MRELRALGPWLISYLDDFSRRAASATGRSTRDDTLKAERDIEELCARLGLRLYPKKQEWGKPALEILGVLVDTRAELYLLSPTKLVKLRKASMAVLREGRRNRRLVHVRPLCSFAGLAKSCSMAISDACVG